jgi:hypothetical protein
MKKALLSITFTLAVCCSAFAQYSHTITSDGPSHVLKPGYSRIAADTVYYITHTPNPFDPNINLYDGTPRITGSTIIKHSEDGLTDTSYIASGLARIDIRHYNENQRVVYAIFDYPHCLIHECYGDRTEYMYEKVEIAYDAEDRVSKTTTKEIGSISGEEKIVSVDTYDYSTLKTTEKGYIYDGYEYELDALNRVTYLKNLNSPDEYRELNGRRYRVQDLYYTYSESGLSVLHWEKTSDMIYGLADRWVKTDYYFKEDGNGSIKTTSHAVDGETWTVWEKTETRYAYAEDTKSGDIPNSNESPESSGVKVYGIPGAIVVGTVNSAQVCVYDTAGRVVGKQSVSGGTARIAVPGRGLYFVTVNNNSYKALVK